MVQSQYEIPVVLKSRKLSRSDFAIIILVAVLFVTSQIATGGGDNLTSLCIVTIYGIVAGALSVLRWIKEGAVRSGSVGIPAALFALAVLLALFSISPIGAETPHPIDTVIAGYSSSSIDQSRTLIELIKLCGLGCAFLVGLAIGSSRIRARSTIQALNILVALFGIASIITFATAPNTFMGFGHKYFFPERLTASFLSANTAGTFFGTCVMLALYSLLTATRLIQQRKLDARWIGRFFERCAMPTVAILVSVTTLVLSASRTAMLATGFAALLFVLAEGLSRRWSIRGLTATLGPMVIFGLAAASFIGGGVVMQRLNFLQGDSLVRTHIYQAHIAAMRPYPWFGVGLGNFEIVNRSLLAVNIKNYVDLHVVRAMHELYLQWIEGAGWLGASPMFACIGFILVYMARGAMKWRENSTEIWAVLAISLLILIHGLTDFAVENYSIAGWWSFLLGVGYSLAKNKRYLDMS